MTESESVLVGKSDTIQSLFLKRANRHGLIAGATGTGKTITLQTLAEGFSQAGVPVFASDIKGDLSGISQAIEPKPNLTELAARTLVKSATKVAASRLGQ